MRKLISKGAGALLLGLVLSTSVAANDDKSKSAGPKIIKPLAAGIPHSALFGLSFDAGKGVAVGIGGSILQSNDAGQSWLPVEQKESGLALLSVVKAGAHTVAVGQSGLVMIEEAPGKWKKIDAGTTNRLLSVSANSSGLVVAAGQFGVVMRSTDGGQTWANAAPDWKEQEDPNTFGTGEPTLYSVNVDEKGVVTLAGEYGVIMRSDDGASSWRIVRRIDAKAATLFAAHVAPAGSGNSYAVGQRGEMLVSADGGETWVRKLLKVEGNFLGVAANQQGHVVVTGMRIMVRSKNDGKDWTMVKDGDATTEWYQAVRAEAGSGRILAVGHAGRIIEIGS
ncbi:MAG: hypothetical protein V4650_00615 [Pseudomonadota bacterium]